MKLFGVKTEKEEAKKKSIGNILIIKRIKRCKGIEKKIS